MALIFFLIIIDKLLSYGTTIEFGSYNIGFFYFLFECIDIKLLSADIVSVDFAWTKIKIYIAFVPKYFFLNKKIAFSPFYKN